MIAKLHTLGFRVQDHRKLHYPVYIGEFSAPGARCSVADLDFFQNFVLRMSAFKRFLLYHGKQRRSFSVSGAGENVKLVTQVKLRPHVGDSQDTGQSDRYGTSMCLCNEFPSFKTLEKKYMEHMSLMYKGLMSWISDVLC